MLFSATISIICFVQKRLSIYFTIKRRYFSHTYVFTLNGLNSFIDLNTKWQTTDALSSDDRFCARGSVRARAPLQHTHSQQSTRASRASSSLYSTAHRSTHIFANVLCEYDVHEEGLLRSALLCVRGERCAQGWRSGDFGEDWERALRLALPHASHHADHRVIQTPAGTQYLPLSVSLKVHLCITFKKNLCWHLYCNNRNLLVLEP